MVLNNVNENKKKWYIHQDSKPYYFYTDAPSEPVWFKNLRKAWTSTQRTKALKEAISERDSGYRYHHSMKLDRTPPNYGKTRVSMYSMTSHGTSIQIGLFNQTVE